MLIIVQTLLLARPRHLEKLDDQGDVLTAICNHPPVPSFCDATKVSPAAAPASVTATATSRRASCQSAEQSSSGRCKIIGSHAASSQGFRHPTTLVLRANGSQSAPPTPSYHWPATGQRCLALPASFSAEERTAAERVCLASHSICSFKQRPDRVIPPGPPLLHMAQRKPVFSTFDLVRDPFRRQSSLLCDFTPRDQPLRPVDTVVVRDIQDNDFIYGCSLVSRTYAAAPSLCRYGWDEKRR